MRGLCTCCEMLLGIVQSQHLTHTRPTLPLLPYYKPILYMVHRYYAATTDDPDEIYAHAVKGLNAFPLAYLLLSEPRWTGRSDGDHVRR